MNRRRRKQTMEIKTVLFLAILLVVVHRTYGINNVPEFQYPCYIDVCSFPRQYCNFDERRCSPCSRAICHSPEVPTACRYICIKYEEVATTTKIPSLKTTTTAEHETGEGFTSLHLLMTYSVIGTSILIIMLAIVIICYCICKDKILMKRRSEKEANGVRYSSVELGKQDNVVIEGGLQIPVQAVDPCPTCGQLSNQRPFPENHQTHIGTETDPPSYKPYDSRQNMRPNRPLVDTPSDSTESSTALVTNSSRLRSIATSTGSDEHCSMHEQPWADRLMQRNQLNNPQPQSNTDNTLPKMLNG